MPAIHSYVLADFTSLTVPLPNFSLFRLEAVAAGRDFDGADWTDLGPPVVEQWDLHYFDSTTKGQSDALVAAHTGVTPAEAVVLSLSTAQNVSSSLVDIGFDVSELDFSTAFTWVFGSPVTVNVDGTYVIYARALFERTAGADTIPEICIKKNGIAQPTLFDRTTVTNMIKQGSAAVLTKLELVDGDTITAAVIRFSGNGTIETVADSPALAIFRDT